jgi:aldehyde dehydrogenase (NAD+)
VSHDHHDLFIAGRLTPAHSVAVLTTINPATEEPVGSVPGAGADDIDAAVKAALAAFRESGWPQLAPKERARPEEPKASGSTAVVMSARSGG